MSYYEEHLMHLKALHRKKEARKFIVVFPFCLMCLTFLSPFIHSFSKMRHQHHHASVDINSDQLLICVIGLVASAVLIFLASKMTQMFWPKMHLSCDVPQNSALRDAVSIELSLAQAAEKSAIEECRKKIKEFKKLHRENRSAFDHIPGNAAHLQRYFASEATRISGLTDERTRRLYRNTFPNYDKYRADEFFSYDSFGTNADSYFQFLKQYFKSSSSELFDAHIKQFEMTDNDLREARRVYVDLLIRIDAYHRARQNLSMLSEDQQTTQSFQTFLKCEYSAIKSRISLKEVSLLQCKRDSYLPAVEKNLIVDNSDDEYQKRLLYFDV